MKKVKPWWNIKQLFFAIYELKLCSSTSITWTLNMVWEKLKKKTMTHIKMRLRIGTAKCATVGFPGGRSHSVIIIWEGLILTLIIFTRQEGWFFVDAYIPEDVKHPLHCTEASDWLRYLYSHTLQWSWSKILLILLTLVFVTQNDIWLLLLIPAPYSAITHHTVLLMEFIMIIGNTIAIP